MCKDLIRHQFAKLALCFFLINSVRHTNFKQKKYSRNREKFNILPTLITETQLHKYLIQRRISPAPPPPVFSINSTRPEKNVETIIGFLHSHEDRIPFPVKICISKSWENEGTSSATLPRSRGPNETSNKDQRDLSSFFTPRFSTKKGEKHLYPPSKYPAEKIIN